jgi:hypothetical protein
MSALKCRRSRRKGTESSPTGAGYGGGRDRERERETEGWCVLGLRTRALAAGIDPMVLAEQPCFRGSSSGSNPP